MSAILEMFCRLNAPLRQNPPIYPCVKEVRIRSYSGPHFSRIFPHFPDSFNAVTLCFGIFFSFFRLKRTVSLTFFFHFLD